MMSNGGTEDLLSDRIRYFSFHLGVLHGTKTEARRFFRSWADEAEALEAKLSKMERQIELAQNAMVRAQPTTHELDGAIVIWEVAWNELREALAGGDDEEAT